MVAEPSDRAFRSGHGGRGVLRDLPVAIAPAPVDPPARPLSDADLDEFVQRGLEHVHQATRDLQGLVELLQMLQARTRRQTAALQGELAEARDECDRLSAALERERAASAAAIADLQRRLATTLPAHEVIAPLDADDRDSGWREWAEEAKSYATEPARGERSRVKPPLVLPVAAVRATAPASERTTVIVRRVPSTAEVRALQAAVARWEAVSACHLREFAEGSLVLDVEHRPELDLAAQFVRDTPFDMRVVRTSPGAAELQML